LHFLGFEPEVIIAGWAGRDPEAVARHVAELAAIGVPAPSAIPVFYRIAPDRLTQAEEITVVGSFTSGEVEPVLIWTADGIQVGVGSDHTDRESESLGVAIAKQLCPKIIGRSFWRYDDVAPHWDSLVLRAFKEVDGVRSLYQEDAVSSLLHPDSLIAKYRERNGEPPRAGHVMFCGTVPVRGAICRADAFEFELHDPVRGETLRHRYAVRELPVVS
jgi:hypothetical protein